MASSGDSLLHDAGPITGRENSLRNYKLHIYQVQLLQLDAEEYAKSMAGALAVIHWHTEVDMDTRSEV